MRCELCDQDGGVVLLRNALLRIVQVGEPDYPGFCRVIVGEHVRELTDLTGEAYTELMRAVWAVERAQRAVLSPYKINVASLGNLTPHLHWHLIPRFQDDAHFPQPIWGTRQRNTPPEVLATRHQLAQALGPAIERALTSDAKAGTRCQQPS